MSARDGAGTGAERPRRVGRHLWGAAATAVALLACYGTMALVAALSLMGLSLAVDEGLWAVAIAAAAVIAVAATGLNLRRHGRPWPLLLAALGAALILYAMFGAYHPVVEGLGFAALVGAVVIDLMVLGVVGRRGRQGGEEAG